MKSRVVDNLVAEFYVVDRGLYAHSPLTEHTLSVTEGPPRFRVSDDEMHARLCGAVARAFVS